MRLARQVYMHDAGMSITASSSTQKCIMSGMTWRQSPRGSCLSGGHTDSSKIWGKKNNNYTILFSPFAATEKQGDANQWKICTSKRVWADSLIFTQHYICVGFLLICDDQSWMGAVFKRQKQQMACQEDATTLMLLLVKFRVWLRCCLLFLFPAVFLVLLFPLLLGFVLWIL